MNYLASHLHVTLRVSPCVNQRMCVCVCVCVCVRARALRLLSSTGVKTHIRAQTCQQGVAIGPFKLAKN